MKTAEKYYEELRKQGETNAITSNPKPDYTLPFYQAIFGLMEGYFNQQKEDICKKQREICADVAEVFLPSHPALHGTANINREEILNAPEPDSKPDLSKYENMINDDSMME